MKNVEELLTDIETAYRTDDDDLLAECEDKLREIMEGVECVIATAHGNTSGLSESEQLEAMRASVSVLSEAINN